MKNLKHNFFKRRLSHPHDSDYICMAEAIKGKHFHNRIIKRDFELLVDHEEYDKNDKKQILKFLYILTKSKPTEASSFWGIKSPRTNENIKPR